MLQQLPNGCSCSTLAVYPKKWKRANAPVSKDWYIHYRFYDPTEQNPKKVIIKGMNSEHTAARRRQITEILLQYEIDQLNKGYNPFKKRIENPQVPAGDMNFNTTFVKALRMAHEGLVCKPETKTDIRCVLNFTETAITQLGYDQLSIGEIRKKHIKTIFVKLSKTKKIWNANQHNHYRKYLGILFNEIMEYLDLEYNPAYQIKRLKTVKRLRKTLTLQERKTIDLRLRESKYTFWRFMHIFFHSSSRESELMLLKKSDVDIVGQKFKVTILKGMTETFKPIKDIVLPLWQQVYNEAKTGQFLFAKGLCPGDVSINPRQITRRWRVHVKEKLNIEADFYSMKHSNLDEIAAALSLEDASKAASHTTPVITMDYTYGEKERQMNRVKKVNNAFS